VSRVGWFLKGFVLVGIGLLSMLVPTKSYKENFFGFVSKGFPRKYCVMYSVVDRSYVKNCIILIPPSQYKCVLNTS
jgi:hypothetical protein